MLGNAAMDDAAGDMFEVVGVKDRVLVVGE